MSQKPPPGDGSLRIFVRRGALRRFDKLKREATDLPLAIEWDRRKEDAAAPTTPDRRKEPSFTWKLADFVVDAPEPSADADTADNDPDSKPKSDA